MTSKTYKIFLDSMIIDFDKWHDGIGYDLEILGRMEPQEKDSIEDLLIKNLKQVGDWRDVEALVALGTTKAFIEVDKARFHKNAQVRNYALKIIINIRKSKDTAVKDMAGLEQQVIRAVENGHFKMAESMPTLRVKKALLNSVRESSDSVIRVNGAAFLLYICGKTSEPFDWDQRQFFLRFKGDNPEDLQQVWKELRKRTGL